MSAATLADLADPWAYRTLGELCDTIGPRLAGSPAMARAVAWAQETMQAAGCDTVWTEPVTIPHWTRGREWARCTAPVEFDLVMLGLGLSDGTGPEGLEAEVLAVRDFDELDARSAEAAGRIVLFNMEWDGYGPTVQYRSQGASRAARHGAVAVLVRSVTANSLATPHTGMMRYEEGVPRIPAAAVTVEDAGRLQRLADAGLQPRVRLMMEARNRGETVCHNVIGEIRGAVKPQEIVLVAGHLDSWDVGTGAHDDGAGCVIALAAARRLLTGGGRPDRTVRVVFYTAEEIGGIGGTAYRDAHRDELPRHVAALESDSGAFAPAGFTVQGDSLVVAAVAGHALAVAALGAGKVSPGWSGVDIGPICKEGVPGIGHRVDGSRYFDYHHSPADTFDKIDPGELARNVAAVAGLVRSICADPVALRDRGRSAAAAGGGMQPASR
ncbi:MAG: M20/M25/M40 family metallo-hydrolase [Krumholzibacteria bacterium]|nr:M20/M25/M40 family metallo-hydrolase [Candidatus Krumholzibacteria bacterium]